MLITRPRLPDLDDHTGCILINNWGRVFLGRDEVQRNARTIQKIKKVEGIVWIQFQRDWGMKDMREKNLGLGGKNFRIGFSGR